MDSCPNCGTDLPRHARVCPECGSDDETGWSDRARVSELGLPDDSFEYETFIEQEFGKKKEPRIAAVWLWTAVLLLAVLGGGLLYYFFKATS